MSLAACGGSTEQIGETHPAGDASPGGGTGGTAGTGGGSGTGTGGTGIILVDAEPRDVVAWDVATEAGCSGPRDASLKDPADASGITCFDGTPAKSGPPWDFQCTLDTAGCAPLVWLSFDANGILVAVESVYAGQPGQDVLDCLKQFLGRGCYPSLACTRQPLTSHCWIA